MEPSIKQTNLLDIAKNLTSGDESELNYLIQSGDVSRALQLTAAAISVVDVIALAKTKESQDPELTEKRIMVKIYFHEPLLGRLCVKNFKITFFWRFDYVKCN